MIDQLKEALKLFGEGINDGVTSPTYKHLFDIDENRSELNEEKSDKFHSAVAKLLFNMKRARPDLETTISFLMKRISRSTKQDWEKLRQCMGFIKKTLMDRRCIGVDSMKALYTWVDVSHAVHMNRRGHTRGCITMVTDMIHYKLSIQKINTNSK